jgi:hypothetical protein
MFFFPHFIILLLFSFIIYVIYQARNYRAPAGRLEAGWRSDKGIPRSAQERQPRDGQASAPRVSQQVQT